MSDAAERPRGGKGWRHLVRGAVRKGVDLSFEEKFKILMDSVFTFDQDFDEEAVPFITTLLESSTKNAHDIMVPRSRVVTVSRDMSLEKVVGIIKETGHSRYPIQGHNVDSVLGLLHAKDLLATLISGDNGSFFDVAELRRDAKVVPQDQSIVSLLREFQRDRVHLAVVENEYSQIVGLVTMEDIFEQFFGEIHDEHDMGEAVEDLIQEEDGGASPHDNGHTDVSADLSIDEFNEHFDSSLSNDQNNTIGGYLSTKLGHVPVVGEKTKDGDIRFEVLEATERRIVKIRVKRNGQ
ncbi:MAG: CBS domain-containing protein [Gammaproteobacteria bacterium]|nr:CBS domain-containing protein [Gammaproteobacteria bacterium]